MKTITLIFTLIFSVIFVNAQDVIYKNDGIEIKSEIIEITPEVIKYKKFDQLQGPVSNININEVFMIVYKDGKREVFKDKAEAIISKESTYQPEQKKDKQINSTLVSKDNIFIKIEDKRDSKIIVGKILFPSIESILVMSCLLTPVGSVIWGLTVPKKIKDNNQAFINLTKNEFLNILNSKGFHKDLQFENSQQTLKIDIVNLYRKVRGHIGYLEVEQTCSVTILLINNSNNMMLFNKDFSNTYIGREYFGKKAHIYPSPLKMVLENITDKLMNDYEFQSVLSK